MLWKKISLSSITKGQPALKSDQMSTWPKSSSSGVHLTWGQPDWSSNTLGYKMSLPVGYVWSDVNWTEVVTHLATNCLCLEVHLSKGKPDPKSDQMSTWPKASFWGVHLTRGQPDWSSNTLATRCLCWGNTSNWRSAWPKDLTKMSTWTKA